MRSAEPLITADSSYHNYEPSRTARLYWLYPLCAGYFTYQKGYHLERASYDSWLLEVILDGEAIIQTKGKTYVAQAGDIVLLDCHKQHGYSSQTGWKALWVHFDGISAQGYADMIVPQNPVIRHPRAGEIVQSIQIIYDMLATPSPEKETDTVEITDALNTSGKTEITVSADNGFSDHALPYSRSFDWANDGGLFRPVECRSTGRICLWDLEVTAQPVILPTGKRQNQGQAVFGFRHVLDGARSGDTLQWSLHAGAADSMEAMEDAPLLSGTLHPDEAFAPCVLRDISYWHFDRPLLYTLRLKAMEKGGRASDERDIVFGFRELKLRREKWLLNGEAVRLPGMEWMPGSDPDKGMAESKADLEHMLALVKESNSVLTRFHWQQDDWVYDWCDRHGLLVQEEIPFWGKQPEGDPEKLWPVVKSQLEEMIAAHRHHPSIIAWGVGNELSGQEEAVQRYVRNARAFARNLDGTRPVSYVTNTAWQNDFDDAAKDGDILCVNDYIGTWHQGLQQEPAWENLLAAHPGRAFIPSEFGLCEPAFSGGDKARERIFLEKTSSYRPKEQIVGTVYFCLNDYRTHMGEEGEGRLRRRVHGSAGLRGEPKPSYFTVRKEHAPLIARWTAEGLRLTCRNDLPRYAVEGYILQTGEAKISIPDLLPGETWLCREAKSGEAIRIYRPNGDFVMDV